MKGFLGFASAFKIHLCLGLFLAGIVGKLWLIWQSEISDDRDDSHEYALQILYPANGGLDYGPGTGWVGRLFYDVGLPFRLGIEVLFMLAVALTLKALFDWPSRSYLSLGLFLFTIFDPALADLFSHLYSDQVWLVETLIGFSCLVLAWRQGPIPKGWLLYASAFCLGISTVTRSIAIPLLLVLALFALGSVAIIRRENRKKWLSPAWGALLLSMVTLGLVIGIIHQGTCFYNSRCHGYDGISVVDSSALKKFYFCLQSVGEPTGEPHFAIDQNRREEIARAGPVSKWFMAELDKNDYVRNKGLIYYGKSDIPSAWIVYAFFNAALPATHSDLRKCFALFETMENEIAQAGRNGAIKLRPILPLPDSRVSIVLAASPLALCSVVRESVAEPLGSVFAWNPELYQDRDFTRAVSRRTVEASPLREKIWRFLRAIYAFLYSPLTLCLYLIIWLGFLVLAVGQWNRLPAFSVSWMAQQLFSLFFVILLGWYTLFDASGWPVVFRYMVYNHVMLPILILYYTSEAVRLCRNEIHP